VGDSDRQHKNAYLVFQSKIAWNYIDAKGLEERFATSRRAQI